MTDREEEEQQAAEVRRGVEQYCAEYPDTPATHEQPRLLKRGSCWVALSGSSQEDSIAGIGDTVPEALAAFDARFFEVHPRRD